MHPDPILRVQVLDIMRQRWMPLSDLGWHYVVAGLAREGQLEAALEGLQAMRNALGSAKVESWLYDLIIYVLCDMDEVDEAYRLMMQRMPVEESYISRATWYYLFDTACGLLHVSCHGPFTFGRIWFKAQNEKAHKLA